MYWLVAGVIGVWFARRSLKNEAVRRRWHFWLLGLPLIGRLERSRNAAQLASTLAESRHFIGVLLDVGARLLEPLGGHVRHKDPVRHRDPCSEHPLDERLGHIAAAEKGNLLI